MIYFRVFILLVIVTGIIQLIVRKGEANDLVIKNRFAWENLGKRFEKFKFSYPKSKEIIEALKTKCAPSLTQEINFKFELINLNKFEKEIGEINIEKSKKLIYQRNLATKISSLNKTVNECEIIFNRIKILPLEIVEAKKSLLKIILEITLIIDLTQQVLNCFTDCPIEFKENWENSKADFESGREKLTEMWESSQAKIDYIDYENIFLFYFKEINCQAEKIKNGYQIKKEIMILHDEIWPRIQLLEEKTEDIPEFMEKLTKIKELYERGMICPNLEEIDCLVTEMENEYEAYLLWH